MGHFYGTVHGNRGRASRLGTARSGLMARAAGRHIGAKLELAARPEGDLLVISIDDGSAGRQFGVLVGEFQAREGKLVCLRLNPKLLKPNGEANLEG